MCTAHDLIAAHMQRGCAMRDGDQAKVTEMDEHIAALEAEREVPPRTRVRTGQTIARRL